MNLCNDNTEKRRGTLTAVGKTTGTCQERNVIRVLIMEYLREEARSMSYDPELMMGWIEDTVKEKLICKFAEGYNQRQKEIISAIQNSELTQEQKDLFTSIIGPGRKYPFHLETESDD